jgi:hypothetical protein
MKILQKIESWLVNSKWCMTKLENIKSWITNLIIRWETVILTNHAEQLIKLMNLSEEDCKIIKPLANNYIKYNSIRNLALGKKEEKPLSSKIMLSVIIKTAKLLKDGIGQIIDIQPMEGPVAQIFNLEYQSHEDEIKREGDGSKKLSLILNSRAIEAYSRKLDCNFHLASSVDHGHAPSTNYQPYIVNLLAEEICKDITDDIINKLVKVSTESEFSLLSDVDQTIPSFIGDKLKKIADHIDSEANEIGNETKRGKANWIVVSPMVVTFLQTSGADFVPDTTNTFSYTSGLMFTGTLNKTIKVYTYLWNNIEPGVDTILMGYKGIVGCDTNYIYAPYNLLIDSDLTMHPATFVPMIGLLTRSGEQFYNTKGFRTIKLKDIAFV